MHLHGAARTSSRAAGVRVKAAVGTSPANEGLGGNRSRSAGTDGPGFEACFKYRQTKLTEGLINGLNWSIIDPMFVGDPEDRARKAQRRPWTRL